MDGADVWKHTVNHTHNFVIDLGETLHVEQARGRSGGDLSCDPIAVNIYVSTDGITWGDAVNPAVITTWQDTTVWQEVALTHKDGRYVKVEITTTESGINTLEFGGITGAYFKIFDIYAT